MEAQVEGRLCGQCGNTVRRNTRLTPCGEKHVCPQCLPGQRQRVGKETDVTVGVWSRQRGEAPRSDAAKGSRTNECTISEHSFECTLMHSLFRQLAEVTKDLLPAWFVTSAADALNKKIVGVSEKENVLVMSGRQRLNENRMLDGDLLDALFADLVRRCGEGNQRRFHHMSSNTWTALTEHVDKVTASDAGNGNSVLLNTLDRLGCMRKAVKYWKDVGVAIIDGKPVVDELYVRVGVPLHWFGFVCSEGNNQGFRARTGN